MSQREEAATHPQGTALMSSTPLSSTYNQGGRHHLLHALFERIGLSLTEEIRSRAPGGATLETIAFTNQPETGTGSGPDARISADFTYLFGVKTIRGTVDVEQLRAHLKALGKG
ncbi:hypothetical protein [Nocardiopsis sp. CA-288880]|uniref:hypothetical protein n=1 Tax=Nocardiopsis sp. CA-288880 TaxID=3239995 RepID=UPI003D97FC6D